MNQPNRVEDSAPHPAASSEEEKPGAPPDTQHAADALAAAQLKIAELEEQFCARRPTPKTRAGARRKTWKKRINLQSNASLKSCCLLSTVSKRLPRLHRASWVNCAKALHSRCGS